MSEAKIEDLVGVTLTSVVWHTHDGGDALLFVAQDGRQWRMQHEQECCEAVVIEDIDGNLEDLVGVPITTAYESSNTEETDDLRKRWTFYRFGTSKGLVVIRWHGQSNGYYSESVGFDLVKEVSDD
jgi:hypothetical protein